MAKQQKKSAARKAPKAPEPRMYGDGKPSSAGEAPQAVAQQPAAAAKAAPATRTSGSRTSGITPRGAGATGSFARVDRITDYSYVKHDLRHLGIVAASILAGLVVLGIIVK